MTPVEPLVVERGPVDKTFRPFDPDQIFLVPPSLDEWLPQNHLARFIADLVDEHLVLSAFYADYKEGRGAPPFDPRLMVRVLLLGYTTGVRSSRKLEEACWDKVAFRWLAGGQAPAYRAIAKFRKRHLSALGHLFVQALELCQAAGMVSLGKVALDGTKVRANASRRKAMSYARMSEKQKILAAEVSDLLAEAERIDKDEDAKFGKDNKGYGLPDELARREGRSRRSPRRRQRWRPKPPSGPPRRLLSGPALQARTRRPSRNGPLQQQTGRSRNRRRNATSPTRNLGS